MTAHPPAIQGELAAQAGKPYTANPFTAPAKPPSGEGYPGDWALWLSGWRSQAQRMGKDATEARAILHAFTMRGL